MSVPGSACGRGEGPRGDEEVCFSVFRMGGIPAVGGKGDNLLLFIGIIDILQSYRSEVQTFYFLFIFKCCSSSAGGAFRVPPDTFDICC